MDIGEEQSNSHVLAVAWSPPGLAIHQRSVLAILTSNNVLSLWASHSNTKDQLSWKRVLTVNNAFKGRDCRMQIRCMAWCPSITYEPERQSLQKKPQKSPFILAIGQDRYSKVNLLGISSPYLSHKRTEWSISEMGGFNTSNQLGGAEPASLLDQQLEKAAIIDFIKFGPTKTDPSVFRTIISCRSLGDFTHFAIHMNTAMPYEPRFEIIPKLENTELYDKELSSGPALWLRDNVCCVNPKIRLTQVLTAASF